MSFNNSADWSPPTTVHPSQLHKPLPSGYPFNSLVPPFSGKTPVEILKTYYGGGDKHDPTDSKGVSPENAGAAGK